MLQLYNFLLNNKDAILRTTEQSTLDLAGARPSSAQLRQGLPIFFQQLLEILLLRRSPLTKPAGNDGAEAEAAKNADEVALAKAAGKPEEAKLARSGGLHGSEMLRLGYTLSHVVHAYGAMCQAITKLAMDQHVQIATSDFHDLNECLDVAIAGAVTEYEHLRDTQERGRETEHLGHLAHELRNALNSATLSLHLARRGTVGLGGNTGLVLENSLKRIGVLVDRSLSEVRLRLEPGAVIEPRKLLLIVDQILVTAELEAQARGQKIELEIDPGLVIEADQEGFYSALSNIIQNALKFTPPGGRVRVSGKEQGEHAVIEVEDECGGLKGDLARNLFTAFDQQNEDRTGLGLGLTIARRAIELNQGTLEARSLEGRGCIFKITLPKASGRLL